jgi:hypothetical protein
VSGHHAGLALDGALDRLARHVPLAEQVDERLGVPAEGTRVDRRGVAADDALALQPVHPALDRGRGQVHVAADVLEGAAGVLTQQRNDSAVDLVHPRPKCRTPATNRR